MDHGLPDALPLHSGGQRMPASDHLDQPASEFEVPRMAVVPRYGEGHFYATSGAKGEELDVPAINSPHALPVHLTTRAGTPPRGL